MTNPTIFFIITTFYLLWVISGPLIFVYTADLSKPVPGIDMWHIVVCSFIFGALTSVIYHKGKR